MKILTNSLECSSGRKVVENCIINALEKVQQNHVCVPKIMLIMMNVLIQSFYA